MKLIWNGHSCFTLETAEGSVVFDPYQEGAVPGFSALHLTGDLVLCSHDHRDHNACNAVTLTGRSPAFQVEKIATFHDPEKGVLRGPNTIHIITAEEMRLCHAGDLGCELTKEQLERLTGLDVLLIPVGGYYTIDADQAAALVKTLRPRIVVPMHYRSDTFGYEVIGPVDAFLTHFDNVKRYEGNILEITKDTPAQTAVPTYLG